MLRTISRTYFITPQPPNSKLAIFRNNHKLEWYTFEDGDTSSLYQTQPEPSLHIEIPGMLMSHVGQ